MNILQTETLKGWGGQQNKIILESIALGELGHKVILVCNPGARIRERAEKHGIQTFELEMNKGNYHRTIPFFLRLIRSHSIDLVITHGSTDSWIGGMAAWFSRANPRSLRERHNLFPIRSRPSRWLHHSLFDGVLSISEAVSDYLREIGVSSERILPLPDCVDTERFRPSPTSFRQAHGIPDSAQVVGTVTSLRKQKGVWDCYQVARRVLARTPAYFVFGGTSYPDIEGQIMDQLEQEGLDCSRVIWTGFSERVSEIMNALDVFVFLSHSEGLGTVLLEAMACELPAVVYDRRPMSDLVSDGVNGHVVPFGDTEQATDRILSLLRHPDVCCELGRHGRRMVEDEYSYPALKRRLALITGR